MHCCKTVPSFAREYSSMTGNHADVMRLFAEELAKYRAYAEYLSRDSGIASMSLQCIADSEMNSATPLVAFAALKRAS
jgi:hypothetical protein